MTECSNRIGLARREGCCNFVKKTSTSCSMKKNYTVCQREDDLRRRRCGAPKESVKLQINKLGPICETRKKTAAAFPELEEEEDCDLCKQFGKQICFDQDECMWLSSSDCLSSSSFFDKYKLNGLCHISFDEWLVSWLSILGNSYLFLGRGITFFDGSRINPIEEASLALERTIPDAERILQEDLKEEEVVTWLRSSTAEDATESSVTCSESTESSYRQSSEDYTSSKNSSTLISTHLDSSSQKWDLDRLGLLVSLVNLDGEDSKWISETGSELDSFQSNLPSPSFNSSWCAEVRSSNSSVSSLGEINHEKSQNDLSSEPSDAADLEDLDTDDPLFWPFERKFDWTSGDCFSMSPRKDMDKVATPGGTSPSFIGLRLHDRKMNLKEGCKRRLAFSSASTASKILESKQRNDKKCFRNINTTPSRLRKLTKISMKIVPLDMEDDIIEPIDEIFPKEKSVVMYENFLEEDFASKEELPIESLLGLDEFDGHEGVDLEFNKDDFFLDESL
ncbi:hypothetical protein L1049_016900 [Liquidambar formosana]|uniref:Uncharacterized protein n=1 Tax=Liquidambar formosana TaxID=63359 RepID=A0AAP0X741_LIQFO